jgi:hypothetical protein
MDIYDREVARLTASPHLIEWAWSGEDVGKVSPLFQFASKDGNPDYTNKIGCLTQIRDCNSFKAETEELTKLIKADIKIPCDPEQIIVEDLPHFAAWQRRIDKELGRQAPEDWTP